MPTQHENLTHCRQDHRAEELPVRLPFDESLPVLSDIDNELHRLPGRGYSENIIQAAHRTLDALRLCLAELRGTAYGDR